MSDATAVQAAPVENKNMTVLQSLGMNNTCPSLMADLTARAEEGRLKYGTYLQPFNGRDAKIDAYQESLDAIMYLEQKRMEGASKPETVDNALAAALLLAERIKLIE